MAPFCCEGNIALTPYSVLASSRFSQKPGEDSKRLQQDSYAKFKYDATKEQDEVIIRRVQEIVEKRDVTMTEDEICYLEELYVPHALAGVMAQNKPESAREKHVWSTGNQKI